MRRPPESRAATGAWRLLVLVLALLACTGAPRPSRASTEEFSTFDVERVEDDDEFLIDDVLARPPEEWRAEWERSPQGFRTSEGCVSSGQWAMRNQLGVRTPLGKRARFGLDLDQNDQLLFAYENLDLWFLFPQPAGTLGFMFRPYFDKSRQDFAISWEAGSDTAAGQLRLTYGLEDLFNNLWVWRQTRVGETGEPYDRHPWEPALRAALRRERWRFAADGKWLTPSRRRVSGAAGGPLERAQTLWGAWGAGSLEARALGVTWGARLEDRQARSTDEPLSGADGDARKTRRLWQGEVSGRGALREGVTLEGHWIYADRMQSYRPPLADARFHAIDRVLQLEAHWAWRPGFILRLGGIADRVGVARTAPTGILGQGTRWERRAYVGVIGHTGRVWWAGVEGIELDQEPYDVWHHHDKGFLMMQTSF
ncbi:MAG TPA: hypothetical protein VMS88_02985 [Terriglobales bacterium]|nr:hypothetical protein [Terriglobales bacterium]